MGTHSKPVSGFSSPVRADRTRRDRRSVAFAPDWLERKLSPSAYVSTVTSDPTDPEPTDLPTYPIPVPPSPPGGPNGPA